ncbi:MAG: hypothetical protein LC687_01735 [Actinobacteria bacterium]|nr:hypothetical protein [Actinomycetota bacterium]
MVSEFPSNSHKGKEDKTPHEVKKNAKSEEKKVVRVTESDVTRRKTPLGKKLANTFVGGDAKSVWAFVAIDVLVPAAKDMFADAVSQGVERMIYGEARSTGRRTGRRPGGPNESYISYNRVSKSPTRRMVGGPPDERSRDSMSRRGRATHDFDEIILATRVEAEEVIDHLFHLVDKYEMVTVADLYNLVGITGTHVDDKWGWVDLRGANVSRIRNGYLLDLPKPEPLD